MGDEPATCCFLPQHRVVLRWLAASSEADLLAGAEAVLSDSAIPWEECGTWVSDGPAVLMDSANAGTDLVAGYPDGDLPEQASVPLPAGRWRVRAVHAVANDNTSVGLVQLVLLGGGGA